MLFALSAVVACAVWSRPEWRVLWLRNGTYYSMLAITSAWLVRSVSWARERWSSPADALRANWPEILLGAGAMTALLLTQDWGFKVLSDETNMVRAARSLSLERRFDYGTESKFYYGAHHFFSNYGFDKRPPLFTFVLSLVNSLTGYRVQNVWLLNAALLAGTVAVTAAALRKRIGRPWNLVAVVWGIANPIVMHTAAGAGVEPLLCLLWAFAGILLLEALEAPSAPSLPLLVVTVALIGLTRIEAGPMAVAMLVVAVAFALERRALAARLRDDWFVWCAPLVVLPVLIQKAVLPGFFQGEAKPFGLDYLVANIANWRTVLAEGGKYYPFNAVVTVVEVVAVLTLTALVLTGRTTLSRTGRVAFWVFSTFTGAFVAIYSVYYWGQPTKSTSARFYALPFFFAGLAVPVVARHLGEIATRWDRKRQAAYVHVLGTVAAVVSGIVFACAFPAAHNASFAYSTTQPREHKIVTEFLASRLRGHNVLLVYPNPGLFLVYDVSVISFETFNTDRQALLRELDRNLYDEVYFIQEISLSTAAPLRGSMLVPQLEIEPMLTLQIDATADLRISRLVRAQATPSAEVSSKPPAGPSSSAPLQSPADQP